MSRVTFVLLFVLFFNGTHTDAQTTLNALQDSLFQVLNKKLADSKDDISKAIILCDIVNFYTPIDTILAKSYLNKLSELYQNNSTPILESFVYKGTALYNSKLGNYQQAKKNLYQYLKLIEPTQNWVWLTQGYLIMGMSLEKLGQLDSASFYLDKGLTTYEQSDKETNKKWLAQILNIKGIIAQRLGDYDESLDYLQQSIRIKKELNDPNWIADKLNIANIQFYQGEETKALETFLEIGKIAEKQNQLDVAISAFTNASIVCSNLKDFERQKTHLLKGLELSKKLGNQYKLALSYSYLTYYESNIGNHRKAIEYQLKALAIAEKIKNNFLIAQLLSQLGASYSDNFQMDSALYFSNRCIEFVEKINHKDLNRWAAEAHRTLGRSYLDDESIQNYKLAVYHLEKYLNWEVNERGAPHGISNAQRWLSEAHAKLGDFEEAFHYLQSSKIINDSLLNEEQIRKATEIEMDANFKIEKEKTEILHQAELERNKLIQYTLMTGLGLLTLLAFFIYRNYRNKQKANQIISNQNKELAKLNQTKDRLFSIIGHDLRKPAIAFRGITKKVNYLLKKKDYQTLDALGLEIEQEASALNALTDNLLNWALTQKNMMPYNPTRIKLSQVSNEIETIFGKFAADKNIHFQNNIQNGVELFADPNALNTILRNLTDNAIKYTPYGGHIGLDAHELETEVEIEISDTGIGMDKSKLESLFELEKDKSQRGTAGEKGTGLGLHLVYELMKLNKGSIEVKSTLGKGTIFQLYLPKIPKTNEKINT